MKIQFPPKDSPKPAEIRYVRDFIGLTQTEAAEMIGTTLRTWQNWEGGKHRMFCGLWELFLVKSGWIKS